MNRTERKIKMIEHQNMVKVLSKTGNAILHDLTTGKAHLAHMALGVCGEAGELADAIKKHVIYNKEIDFNNVVEELGDLEFFMEGIRAELGINREDTLRANMHKLSLRYPSYKFSNEDAQARLDKGRQC